MLPRKPVKNLSIRKKGEVCQKQASLFYRVWEKSFLIQVPIFCQLFCNKIEVIFLFL